LNVVDVIPAFADERRTDEIYRDAVALQDHRQRRERFAAVADEDRGTGQWDGQQRGVDYGVTSPRPPNSRVELDARADPAPSASADSTTHSKTTIVKCGLRTFIETSPPGVRRGHRTSPVIARQNATRPR
jgi:hypothetical protein